MKGEHETELSRLQKAGSLKAEFIVLSPSISLRAIDLNCFLPLFCVCLWPTSFLQHPFLDVGRTVQYRDTLCFTRVEKANGFDLD